jgi:hypothetical protein
MGNMGKVVEREKAREMRAQGAKLKEICEALNVSKSSASVWVRDVEFIKQPRWLNPNRKPHAQMVAKQKEIAAGIEAGHRYFKNMSRKEFFAAGVALYAGEGNKTCSGVGMANTNPDILLFFVNWLREFFDVDESRLKVNIYLHEGHDLSDAEKFWSELLNIPLSQFKTPYRAVADPSRKRTKHIYGCPSVRYHCAHTLRKILGYMDGLLKSSDLPE